MRQALEPRDGERVGAEERGNGTQYLTVSMGWDRGEQRNGEQRQALEHVQDEEREGAGGRGNGTYYLTDAMGRDHGERRQALKHLGRGEGRGRGMNKTE